MNLLTETHISHLAGYLFRTGRAASPESALVAAREMVEEANRTTAKMEAAKRLEATLPLRVGSLTDQQSAARQRSSDRTLRRLTAAVVALGRR